MATPAQPAPAQNVQFGFAAGHTQIENQIFVTLMFGMGTSQFTIHLPQEAARFVMRNLKEAIAQAEVAVIKPVSPIALA